MSELKDALNKFDKMLTKLPDITRHSYDFLYFFRTFLRIKAEYLPTIELGAILKIEKPTIFQDLKKMSKYNQAIEFITHVDFDYNEAVERVNKLKK